MEKPTEKVNLKTKTAAVVDCGLFLEIACKIGEKFKKVYYTTPWISSFPKMNQGYIGYGMPNIERIGSIWEKFDEIDIFIFPDIYFGPLQTHLVSLGKRVWGSRMGEEMEIERDGMKEHMKKLGLPVQPYKVITGLDKLRDYLKIHENVWIKINCWRGHFETFNSPNYKMVEPRLDEIEYQLGALKHITEFVVEDPLDNKVEIGCDMYTVDGKFPSSTLAGIEVKDLGYVGEFRQYKDLPKEVTNFNTKISSTLEKYGYRNFFSTEIRVGKDHKDYMLDFCARSPSPPNELYQEFYTNLAEIIWYGSEGIMVDPIPISKFGVEVLIHSSWADKNWQPVDFPDEIKKYVKLRNAIRIKGRYYTMPQTVGLPEIGAIVGWGKTLQEALKMVEEIAEQVKGYYIEIPLHAMERAQEEMKKTEEFGIKLFS